MSTKRKILLLGGLLAAACCVIPSHGSERCRKSRKRSANNTPRRRASSRLRRRFPSRKRRARINRRSGLRRIASNDGAVMRERRWGASVAAAFPKLRTLLNRGPFSGKMKRRVDASGRKTQVATVAARRFYDL